jgi:hypothetical protein
MRVAWQGPTASRSRDGSREGAQPAAPVVPQRHYAVFLLTYLAAWSLFLVAIHLMGRGWPQQVSGIDLLLLSLATFRLTAIVTEEKVARSLRAPFCEFIVVNRPDGTEVEEEVPAGRGLRRVAGEMILCPWCAGVWIATLLLFFWILLPGVSRAVLLAFSAAAGGLLFEILAKLMDRIRHSLPE